MLDGFANRSDFKIVSAKPYGQIYYWTFGCWDIWTLGRWDISKYLNILTSIYPVLRRPDTNHMENLYLPILMLTLACSQLPAQTFYRGVDLSYVNQMEDCGAVFYEDGLEKDPFQIMADHGANVVRVRLWHDPGAYLPFPGTYSSFDDVVLTITRAKSRGMQVLLDFHYSDTWADPGRQLIPADWASMADDIPVLATALYDYTLKVLTDLNAIGLMPEFVQVGNETNGNILSPAGADLYPVNWTRQSTLLNAGISAVRETGKTSGIQPQIILHIANPADADWWYGSVTANGVSDFDIIGLSFYPEWHHLSVTQTGDIIQQLIDKYGRQVMLVEVGLPWTSQWNDSAANRLSTVPAEYGTPSPQAQRNWLLDISAEVKRRGGMGVIYWEPAWVSTGCRTEWGIGSHWENATFFDFSNQLIGNGGIQFLEDLNTAVIPKGQEVAARILLFPNPAGELITVSGNQHSFYKIVDQSGRTLREGRINKHKSIDIGGLSPGIYILVLAAENGDRTIVRFVKT